MTTVDKEAVSKLPKLQRAVLTKLLVGKLKSGEAVVGGIGHTNFELWTAGQRPENFYMLGSMGLASSIALGVALAQPARKVFALDGDGSILMQLGALGTAAMVDQKNLAIIIWDNGLYQITGSQPTVTSSGTDLVGIARASGIEKSFWAESEAHFGSLIDRVLSEEGPWFIGVKVEPAKPATETDRDPMKIRFNFMDGLGVPR